MPRRLRPSRRLWAALRAAALAVVIPLGYLPLLGGRLLLAPSERARERFTSRYFRRWSDWTLGFIGISVRVSGEPPAAPFLMVANHLSYVDILVLASRLGCVFVSKAEVRGWPLLGPICRTMGTIFIDREARRDIPRVMGEIERELAAGRGVVIFPEGTSSACGTVEPFEPSLLALATRLGRPVHYATLGYRTTGTGDPPAYRAVCWVGGVPFAQHAWGLLQVESTEATLSFAPEPILEPDRKLLAERLRQALLSDLEPMAPAGSEVVNASGDHAASRRPDGLPSPASEEGEGAGGRRPASPGGRRSAVEEG